MYSQKFSIYNTRRSQKKKFRTSTPCRLLNPCKSELGKISKLILEKANKYLADLLSLNQWKNSDMVINWFSSIKNKSQCVFIQLDIMEFYPSITEAILDNAFSFAKQHVEISDKDLRIIKHCRKSLLYHKNKAWKKKNSDDCFYVTMGSYDGAKICELVGTLVLSTLAKSNKLHKIFKRNTVKVSYSCTENISSIMSSHNKKLLKNVALNTKPCNCRTKSTCPLNGQCQSQDIIYKCTVSTSVNPDKVYLRTAEGDFKKRYHNHTKSFRNKRYTKYTSLSKYIWEIKEKHQEIRL